MGIKTAKTINAMVMPIPTIMTGSSRLVRPDIVFYLGFIGVRDDG
jgi:hypothetical protein